MISLPVVTEEQVKQALIECDYEKTPLHTETGFFWKHKGGSRHLMVPFSSGGTFPDWMLQELAQRARSIRDEVCAVTIEGINPWSRLRAKKDRPKPKAKR